MKKIYLALCMILTMIALTACGGQTNTKATTTFDEQTVLEAGSSLLQSWTALDCSMVMTEEGYQQHAATYGEDSANEIKAWQEMKLQIGAAGDGIDGTTVPYSVLEKEVFVNEEEGTATVSITASYPQKTLIFKVVLDNELNYTSISLDLFKTMGEKVINGLLNTVMGMAIVFIVLLMISFIIGLFKYIPLLLERKNKKPEVVQEPPVVATIQTFEEEEELVDDTELVAVITAAIMASMGDEVPADGLRIRSIRRVNKKWKNA